MDNAFDDLQDFLMSGECVEGLVFGVWGWDGFKEPGPPPVPKDKQGVLMQLEDAKPFMEGWSFDGGYGAPTCYATYIWTDKRVIWVTQYDGSTGLDSMPRHPANVIPDMPGE